MREEKLNELSELDKWSEVVEQMKFLEEFISYLSGQGIGLYKVFRDDENSRIKHHGIVVENSRYSLFCKFHGIDPVKLEEERRNLLNQVWMKYKEEKRDVGKER